MEILVLLVVLVAAYWAKNNLLKPETSQAIDDLSRSGMDVVKKTLNSLSDNKAESVVELAEQNVAAASVEEHQSPVDNEPVEQSNKAPKNIATPTQEASPSVAAKKSPEKAITLVPEDSVLSRHYQAQIVAERASITHPYPTDSVLRRHYENRLQAAFNPVSTAQKTDAVVRVEAIDQATSTAKPILPEDSVLKRHFAQLIETKVAA